MYAPEYEQRRQIHDLVVATEKWHSSRPSERDVIEHLRMLDFTRCKSDVMISIGLRCAYYLGHQTSAWNPTVERARKELLRRNIDAKHKLRGLVQEKEKLKSTVDW